MKLLLRKKIPAERAHLNRVGSRQRVNKHVQNIGDSRGVPPIATLPPKQKGRNTRPAFRSHARRERMIPPYFMHSNGDRRRR